MKKLISLLTALSVIISLSACGKAAEAPKSFDRNAVSYSYEETLIAENSNLKLEWDDGVRGSYLPIRGRVLNTSARRITGS